MLRIKDVFNVRDGFFEYINYTVNSFSFDELNFMFISQYGERLLSPLVETLLDGNNILSQEKLEYLGGIIRKSYSKCWDGEASIIYNDFNPFDNYHETLEVYRNNLNNNTTNVNNRIYAFNSQSASDKDESTSQSNGGFNESMTSTKHGLANGNYADIVESALRVHALKLVDIIFNDVKHFISLNLYR